MSTGARTTERGVRRKKAGGGAGEGAEEVREHRHLTAAVSERSVSTSARTQDGGVAPEKREGRGRGGGGRANNTNSFRVVGAGELAFFHNLSPQVWRAFFSEKLHHPLAPLSAANQKGH